MSNSLREQVLSEMLVGAQALLQVTADKLSRLSVQPMTQPTDKVREAFEIAMQASMEKHERGICWQAYKAGRTAALNEQSAEIAELRESQTMALDTVGTQLDLLAERWAEIERLKGELTKLEKLIK